MLNIYGLFALFFIISLLCWLLFLMNGLRLRSKQIFLTLIIHFLIDNHSLFMFLLDFILLQLFGMIPFNLCNKLFDEILLLLLGCKVKEEVGKIYPFFVTMTLSHFTYTFTFLHEFYLFIKKILLPLLNSLYLIGLLANLKRFK